MDGVHLEVTSGEASGVYYFSGGVLSTGASATDASGLGLVPNLPAGTYEVVLEHPVGSSPYTYSDMTGYALKTITTDQGFYREIFHGWPDATTLWDSLVVEADLPGDGVTWLQRGRSRGRRRLDERHVGGLGIGRGSRSCNDEAAHQTQERPGEERERRRAPTTTQSNGHAGSPQYGGPRGPDGHPRTGRPPLLTVRPHAARREPQHGGQPAPPFGGLSRARRPMPTRLGAACRGRPPSRSEPRRSRPQRGSSR